MSTASDAEALAPAVESLLFALVRGRLGEHEPSPFSTTQQLALAFIVDEGPLRLGVLARAIGTTDPTASRAIDVLERAGLVDRRPDPTDGRGVIVASTAQGRRTVTESRSGLVRMLARVLDGLAPGDRERFAELLHGIRGLVGDAPATPAGTAEREDDLSGT